MPVHVNMSHADVDVKQTQGLIRLAKKFWGKKICNGNGHASSVISVENLETDRCQLATESCSIANLQVVPFSFPFLSISLWRNQRSIVALHN